MKQNSKHTFVTAFQENLKH